MSIDAVFAQFFDNIHDPRQEIWDTHLFDSGVSLYLA